MNVFKDVHSLLIFSILTASNSLSIRPPEFSKIKLYVLAVLQWPSLDLRRRWVSQHVTQGFPSSTTTQLPGEISHHCPADTWNYLIFFPKVSFSFSNWLSYMVLSQSGKLFSPLLLTFLTFLSGSPLRILQSGWVLSPYSSWHFFLTLHCDYQHNK